MYVELIRTSVPDVTRCDYCRHTHFKPDQVHSCHSRGLRTKNIFTQRELVQALKDSYTGLYYENHVFPLEVFTMEVRRALIYEDVNYYLGMNTRMDLTPR